MGDVRSTCIQCNNPHIGFIATKYIEELNKLINAQIKDPQVQPNSLFISAEIVFGNDENRKLIDDLGVMNECCRCSLMAHASPSYISKS